MIIERERIDIQLLHEREAKRERERGMKGEGEICITTCNCHYLSSLINLTILQIF